MALSVKDGKTTVKITKIFDRKEKCTKCGFSTGGTKDYKTGEWRNDFDGYCTFVGTAHEKASGLSEKDKIHPTSFNVKVATAKTGKVYADMTIFEYDADEVEEKSDEFMSIPDGIDEEIPFN